MKNLITLERLVDDGLVLGRFDREDIITPSSMKVGTPYLVISASSVSLSSVVIKTTSRAKNHFGGREVFNYFVFNQHEGHKFVPHILPSAKMVQIHSIELNGIKMVEDYVVIKSDYNLGLISSKHPTIILNNPLITTRNDLSTFLTIELNDTKTISFNVNVRNESGDLYSMFSSCISDFFGDNNLVNLDLFTDWVELNQVPYKESLLKSDVPHFNNEDFSNIVFQRVPASVIRSGALQPHSVVWYLTKVLGKAIVQNMYNNRDFTKEDLETLLGIENKSLMAVSGGTK